MEGAARLHGGEFRQSGTQQGARSGGCGEVGVQSLVSGPGEPDNGLFQGLHAGAAGPTGFTAAGNFIARPFPAASNGEFPVVQTTFYAPAAPIGATAGIRVTF